MYVAMVGGLKNDFVRGFVDEVEDPQMKNSCYCDGQYSGNWACRNFGSYNWRFDPKERGICHGDISSLYFTGYADGGGPKDTSYKEGADCRNADSRGMVLILEGGLHFVSRAEPTYRHFGQIFNDPVIMECAKEGKLIVIWCSFNSHSPSIVQKYPHQSIEKGLIFNQESISFTG